MRIQTLIILVLLAGSASAWGPNTHMHITDEAMAQCEEDPECQNSLIFTTINNNQDAYRCGYMFPDVHVIYYYAKFQNYQATHAYSFCGKALEYAENDGERAAAYGCFSHLIADSIAHNYFIPGIIDNTQIPNDIIHPIAEGLVETKYIDNIRTPHSMDNVDLYLPLFNRAAGEGEDLTKEAYLLRTALGGQNFYSSSYTTNEDTWVLKMWKGIADFIVWMDVVNPGMGEDFIFDTIDDTYQYYMTGTYPPLDPTGEQALDIQKSRTQIKTVISFIGIPLVLLILYIVYKKLDLGNRFKGRRIRFL